MAYKYYFPNFINFQRENYYSFLKKGFINEFKKKQQIKTLEQNISILFYPEFYKFKSPEVSAKDCILTGKSYTSKIYIPIQLIDSKKKLIKTQWVLIANLPLMTQRGHFILNGAPRLIINQIIRNPGIYFHEVTGKKKTFYADFISYRGAWLRIELDKKKNIWMKMKKVPKFSMVLLLQSMGLTKQNIFNKIDNSNIIKFSFLKEIHPKTCFQALYILGKLLEPKRNLYFYSLKERIILRQRIAFKFLYKKFLNPLTYDLSKNGRNQLNKKFNLSISFEKLVLTTEDFIAATNYLIKLNYGIGETDDIDSLKNRKIRASGQLLENQLYVGIIRLEKYIKEKFRKTRKQLTINKIVNTKPINGVLKEFFGSSQLSQFMDQTNPLSELTHKRRVTSIGPNGISRETAGMGIRGIHSTHYGRICPIETPEGQNAGLVNSITSMAKVNRLGKIETPLFKVHKGHVEKNLEQIYISSEIEEKISIAPCDLKIEKLNFLPKKIFLSRIGKNFQEINYKNINFITICPLQMISIATSLIPFLEHDDGNRALMGSNMQRQAVPLIITEKALVRTGLEDRVISDSGHCLESKLTGYISFIDAKKIFIEKGYSRKTQNSMLQKNFYSLKNFLPYYYKKSNFQKIKKKKFLTNSYYFFNKKNTTRKKIEYLSLFQRSNQETLLNQKNIIKEKEWIQKGQLLADGSCSQNGFLSLGKNLLLCYMPWFGYNFEDAILINERLVSNEIYSSLHIQRFDIEIKNTINGFEEITKNIPNIQPSKLLHLNAIGIINIGTFIKEGDILIGKITPIAKKQLSPHEKLLYDIVGKEIPTVKDSSLRVPKGVKGKVIDIQLVKNENNPSDKIVNNIKKIHIYIAEKRHIQVGDKISGRHGNKGIIAKIVKSEDMPYLPDGKPVDIILNPLGVPSRMNVGQIFECLFGLAAVNLKENYKILPFDEMFGCEASRSIVFSKLYEASKKTKKQWLFNPLFPGKIHLFDGQTGHPFDQNITVGYSYILKLIHLVDEKIHARSTGPYSLVTQQPLRGRSKHGGQRVGEMEVWALEGYGAAFTLQELLTIKSDDIKGRHHVIDCILKNKTITFGTPESFKVLVRELQSLCLNISIFGFSSKKIKKKIFY
jgi:DNA-directed RNA polymerase subunit beta